ncbi:MAG: helix-turn-helix domain-containing protein, partial [Gallionella sp.]
QKLLDTVAKSIKEGTPKLQMAVPEPQSQQYEIHAEGQVQQISLTLDLPLRAARDHFDALYLDYHLRKEVGNVSRVAEKVGLERTHLYRKLKQLGIKFPKKGGEEGS